MSQCLTACLPLFYQTKPSSERNVLRNGRQIMREQTEHEVELRKERKVKKKHRHGEE